MSALYEPLDISAADIAAALGESEERVLERARSEGWLWSAQALRADSALDIFEVKALPLCVLAKILQWLSWSSEAPPADPARDPWGSSFQYSRSDLWRRTASRSPRQRERGRVRAHAVNLAENLSDKSPFEDAASKAAFLLQDSDRLDFRIESITAKQIEGWYFGADSKPGAKRYWPADRPALLAPRSGRRAGSGIPPEAWACFVSLLLSTDDQPTPLAAYRAVRSVAKSRGWGGLPPLDVFRRRARSEITPELRAAAWVGARDAVDAFLRADRFAREELA